jgi:low affinity Fe/Cu permease
MSFEKETIKEKVGKTIGLLLKNDLFLLKNNSDELTISHRLAEYLQQEFPDWHVDTEYNRDKDQVKKLDEEIVRPDINVHVRNTDNNLLVIEVKKSNNLEYVDRDRIRLKKFTSPFGKYKYHLGLLVIFFVANDHQKTPSLEYFEKERAK